MLIFYIEDYVVIVKSIFKLVQFLLVFIFFFSYKLQFNGFGQFYNRILYVNVEFDVVLLKFVQVLKCKFNKVGISLEGNRDVFVFYLIIMRGVLRDLLSFVYV